jgi:hypothetical protein
MADLRGRAGLAQVRHENVVQVYEVAEQPLPYLAMELIPGETLQQKLDRVGPLDVPEVLAIGRQIAEGLAAAHATDLIHRDIKPGNVLLEGGQQKVKITDFGLARTADDASISHSGIIAGTPMYMAPEQAQGQPLDQRADLFSLGSVLYQMVAGRPPFRANTTVAVLKRVAEDRPRAIREIIPETPPWLCDIIAKLHAKDPDERYQSAREVADVLADCEAQLKAYARLKDCSRIPRSKPQQSGRRKWVAVAAAVLLPVIALAATEFAGLTHLFQDRQATRDSVRPGGQSSPTAQLQRPLSSEPLISIGGQGTAAGCRFTWSNQYEKENADGSPSVGVYFGTGTPPRGPTELLYLVLCKHAPLKSSFPAGRRGMHWTGSGGPVEIVDGPMVYGDAAKLSVRLDADASTGKLTWEECTLNEQKIELSRGRLFLVDLTVNPAQWQQVNVELPRDLPREEINGEIVRRVAEDDVPALRKKHSAVDDFFKARVQSATPGPLTGVGAEGRAKDKPSSPAIAPFTDADVQRIAALAAFAQVEEVRKELVRHNPGFDGTLTPTIENGVVTGLKFPSREVDNIEPVRALKGLTSLDCRGTHARMGKLWDLAPLTGLALTSLDLSFTQVRDLGPLKGMPLRELALYGATNVADLTPLKGMKLQSLAAQRTSVSDLTPLGGMPLKSLDLHRAEGVTDLRPLRGMPLEYLNLSHLTLSDLSLLRGMTSLERLALHDMKQFSDLKPLEGLRLRELDLLRTGVTDLSPLRGMALTHIVLPPVKNITRGLELLRGMESLTAIGVAHDRIWPAAGFWERYDKGEFTK